MGDMTNTGAFQRFFDAAGTIVNLEAKKWLEKGGRVIGYFCSAMPEEIVTAAGLLPFRLRGPGSTETDLADAYFSSLNCSFPRHCFNLALSGEYDFLSGLVMFNSCDALRRTYDHWIRRINTPFVRLLHLPKKAEAPQVDFFRQELADLIREMEEHFSVKITDDRLWEAIRLHNETRRLLRRLYELRKADNPPITGAETLAVTVAGTAIPKIRFNELLIKLLDEIGNGDVVENYRARLMIMGSELDDPRYLEIIENQGGLVVTDSLCFGSRMLWTDVTPEIPLPPLRGTTLPSVRPAPVCVRNMKTDLNTSWT
ncbi:MAG: 2-hydroxyacyl-CoA dehydratase [Deltaproteobacteria bacterium]|nr:2-hydroxyacyl-CoA dehydratase [Deltaproteobacteria bacterium]